LADGDSVMVGAWTRITLRRTSTKAAESATTGDPAAASPAS
jgi:hypothetical protein